VSCNFFKKLLTGNSSSRTRKNSPTGLAKVGASMVGGMFAVVTMSYGRERFIEISTGSGLLGTIP